MGKPAKPSPGKLILSTIFASYNAVLEAINELEKKFGPVQFETDQMPFLHTKYYREEMGDNLNRKFFAFEKAIDRSRLADIKIFTNKLEAKFGEKVRDFVFRKVNLDPGILTLANLVLASTKDFSHRIYLKDGIFAEITLLYEKRKFKALPWTYPDYTEPDVTSFLYDVRNTLLGLDS